MSEERKKEVNIDGLSSLMRNTMIVMGISIALNNPILSILGLSGHTSLTFMAIILIGSVFMVVKAQSFQNKSKNHRKKNLVRTISIALVFAFVAFFVGRLIYTGTRTPDFKISEKQIIISGTYGITTKVDSIKLIDAIPDIKRKTKGFNYGSTLKGSFDLEELGQCYLFIQSKEGPFIFLKTTGGTPIIINLGDSTETSELFDRLVSEFEK